MTVTPKTFTFCLSPEHVLMVDLVQEVSSELAHVHGIMSFYVMTKQMIVNTCSFSTAGNPGPPGPQGPQGEQVTGLLPHHSIKQAQTCD